MLLDTQNLFSDSQSIASGTTYSTNVVRFGEGDVLNVPVIIQVVEDFSGLESLDAEIQTSEDSTFTTPITLLKSNLTLAELKTGALFPITQLPKGNKGYMRLAYKANVASGSSATVSGKITAGVVAALDNQI